MFWKRNRFIASVIDNKCTHCRSCVRICRHHVLECGLVQGVNRTFVSQPERCSGCGKCVSICPNQALIMIESKFY